jgi:MFS family permease
MPLSRTLRMAVAIATLLPMGLALGIPMPAGLRLLSSHVPEMVPWAWGMNGAWSVLGATLAIFVAMNWGFHATLLAAAATYLVGLIAFLAASSSRSQPSRPQSG